MAPLTDLLQTKTTFKWTESAHAAFDALKTVASKPLFLYRPDLGKPFVLQTDASSIPVPTGPRETVRPPDGRQLHPRRCCALPGRRGSTQDRELLQLAI
ncbi:RNase H-like domain found in reverse transcriptase [Popillia japonica]|uniref:RNase H-like domain found in reverse transcriptase n=1 Tax=Popillia japonica TaxID=7064 RepID=A0AAW1KF76_POPJA